MNIVVQCLERRDVENAPRRGGAGIVDHDHFHSLGAHDGADTTAAGMPGGPLFHIREGNRCDRHFHFTGRTDGDAVDFFTVFGFHLVDQIVVAEHT